MSNSNENMMDPEEQARRALRQERDLYLIRTGKVDLLLCENQPWLYRECKSLGLYEGETHDVVNRVCIRMWLEIERGKDFRRVSVHGSFKQKVRWEAGGARKRREGQKGIDLTDPDDLAEMIETGVLDDYSHVECDDYGALYGALDQLVPKQRQVIELTFLEDLTAPEIAAIMGIERNHVHQLKFQGLKRLAVIMGA